MIISYQNIDRINHNIQCNFICKYLFINDDTIINKILSTRTEELFFSKWNNLGVDNLFLIKLFKYLQKEVGRNTFYYFPDDELYACLGDRNDYLCIVEIFMGISVEFDLELKCDHFKKMKDLVLYIYKFKILDIYKH